MIFKKKGEANIIVIVLAVVFIVATSSLVFTWVRKTTVEGSEKSADKVAAQDICNEKVKVKINNVVDNGNSYDVYLENVKTMPISDFIVRMEKDEDAEVKKVKQILGSYESIVLNVPKPEFIPQIIKIVPRITLAKPDLSSLNEGWWICSKQFAQYELY